MEIHIQAGNLNGEGQTTHETTIYHEDGSVTANKVTGTVYGKVTQVGDIQGPLVF